MILTISANLRAGPDGICNPSLRGNENLKPEEITTMEGLVGYSPAKNIQTTLTYFNVSAEKLIQKVGINYQNMGKMKSRGVEFELKVNFDRQKVGINYQNMGKMKSRGVEFELKVNFDKQKYAYFNCTFQDVKNTTASTIVSEEGQTYTQDDFNPGNIPDFIANIGMNCDISEYVNLNVSANYVGKRDRSEAKAWNGETLVKTDSRESVEERTLLNASLTFRNFWKGMEIQLSGFNLLDDDHREPDLTGSLLYDMPGLGRVVMGRISYSF